MENTKFIYAVNSDLDDDSLYAEFETEEAAIEYATKHLDKLPFVDKVELVIDEDGYEDAVTYTTIWDHTMADTVVEPEPDDDYWDMLTTQYEEEEVNKHDLGDTTWFESVSNLVETLEENEDMVECKECFDLFPKADCIKLAFGYVCPTCCPHDISDEDTFKVDFPEYEKFRDTEEEFDDSRLAVSDEDVARVNEPFEEPFSSDASEEANSEAELTPEEAIPFLVADEVEAVAGYEKAAEVVADSDLENKEEILNTIDHIKEEEEEHIEELTELVEPTEEEKVTEEEAENDSVSEDEVEEIEDPETEPVEEAMSDFQRGLIEKLPKMTKEELKTKLESGDPITIFYGDPRELGVRSREYEVTLVNGIYVVTYWEETYNDDFTDSEVAEEFDNIDDLWNFMVNFMEDDDFFPEYNYVTEALTEHITDRAPAIESDQKLKGTDNAVVDCKVADVITHSEDEKPVDCEGKKKPLEKPLTEDFGIYFKNSADWEEFKKLCDEVGIHTMGDVENFMKQESATPATILDKLRVYRDELGADFQIREAINPYKFTEEEMAEYNMDEYGVSLNSYDEYVRCSWCGEIFTKDQCVFEANLGWLCDRCYQAILSRGEKLTIITNPTEEDIARTLTEAAKMSAQELKDKFGTDDTDLLNAGRSEEDRVELTESEDENEPISNDPEEKPSKNVKMANTASTSGMDFEAACQKFGVGLKN